MPIYMVQRLDTTTHTWIDFERIPPIEVDGWDADTLRASEASWGTQYAEDEFRLIKRETVEKVLR